MTIRELREELKTQSIFTENEDYVLRGLREEDREIFFQILTENSIPQDLFQYDLINDIIWEAMMESNTIMALMILEKKTGQYVGDCVIRSHEEEMEIGIDLISAFQGRGVGKTVMAMLFEKVKAVFQPHRIVAKVNTDNVRSERMIRSLGGTLIRTESKLLSDVNVFEMTSTF